MRAILAASLIALAGCSEETYDECVKDAVANGKSEHGIDVLVGLCDTKETERLARKEDMCFNRLEGKYDAYTVSNYKNSLPSWEKCDASADLSQLPLIAETPAAPEYPAAE